MANALSDNPACRDLTGHSAQTPPGSPHPARRPGTSKTCGGAWLGSTLLGRASLPGVAPSRHPGPDTQPDDDDQDHADHCPRADFSDALRDLLTKKIRKPDVHSDPADASGERPEH